LVGITIQNVDTIFYNVPLDSKKKGFEGAPFNITNASCDLVFLIHHKLNLHHTLFKQQTHLLVIHY
jgi:hypothetical protein